MGGTVRNNWQNEADGKVGTEESQRPHQGQHEHSKQRQSPPIIPQRGQERDRTQLVHRPPENHNQHVADPLAHFLAIPWAARLLTDPATFCIVVPGRHPLASGGERLVTKVLNSAGTVRACVTFFMKLPAQWENDENQEREQDERGECRDAGSDPHPGGRDDADNGTGSSPPLSENAAFLQGGGLRDGWGPGTPFLLFNALLDLGEDLCGYKGMMHGGALAVVLDEIMCAAANNQSCCTVTVSMSIRFLRPVKLPGLVVARSRVVKKQGRKMHVRGTIEDGEGNVLAESEAVIIDKAARVACKL